MPAVTVLACALLVAGAPEPRAKPTPFFWPKPELVSEVDIPDVVRADGVPVRLHVIRSRLGVQQLLSLFGSAFREAGFYVAEVQKRHIAEPHVTGLDWRALISYSAILSPEADGTTTCLLGEAALGKKRPPAGADFAPLFPGASSVTRFEDEGSSIIAFSARGTTTSEVSAFYESQLPKAGWRRSEDGALWERAGAHLSLMPKGTSGGGVSVVLVMTRR